MPKNESKVWTVVSAILIVALVFWVSRNIHYAEMIIRKAGIAGPMVAIGLYGIFGPTPISTDPLTVVSGAVFGPVLGILVSWLGNNLAAMVEYLFGRRINKMTNFEKMEKKLPFGLAKLPINSPLVLIFGRMIPGYGGKVISIMAGMYEVPLRRYIWTTAITNLLGSVLLSYVGYNLVLLLK